MFRVIPLCTALVVAIPMSRCHHPSDRENCSLTGAPDAMIQGCSAIIDRGTDKHLEVAYNNRCLAYEIRGDHERAIADCEQAIRLDPKRARAYLGRGMIYEDKGDHDRAITDYGTAIELDPKLAAVYAKRGFVYEAKGDHDRAITDYGTAIELDPKLAAVYALRAIAYAKKGDKQHVIADLRKALTLDPGNEKIKKALSDLGETP
jgi:tetratricopeptide (TPR) repeat protein